MTVHPQPLRDNLNWLDASTRHRMVREVETPAALAKMHRADVRAETRAGNTQRAAASRACAERHEATVRAVADALIAANWHGA